MEKRTELYIRIKPSVSSLYFLPGKWVQLFFKYSSIKGNAVHFRQKLMTSDEASVTTAHAFVTEMQMSTEGRSIYLKVQMHLSGPVRSFFFPLS